MGTEEATRRIIAAAKQAVAAGTRVQVSVQSAFGCGFEGPVAEERVLAMVHAYLDAGLTHVSLADTAGHAHPAQVERLFGAIRRLDPTVACACHFHNTYGLGMANICAALRVGVTAVGTSFGGLGGCPFTKMAAGNVATEDFVHALQRQGLRGDVDLARLIEVEIALKQTRLNPLDTATDGYAIVNLSAGVTVSVGDRALRLDLQVRNLLDTAYRSFLSRYEEFALDPGRNLLLRVSAMP